MKHSWQDILISPDTTMQDTIAVIDKGALQLAIVVDDQHHLKGVVTDGDMRRALLKHKELSCEIAQVMNATPIVAEVGTSKAKLLSLMNRKGLKAIPLLEQGKLVGLETLQHMVDKKIYDNPIFLMAGGFGTRLKPLTDNCPKPLLKLGGKPILEIILERFISAGFHQFYISTHYMPEVIHAHFGDGSKWGVDIHYVHEEKPLGTGGALGLLPANLPDLPLIMMNGDVLTNVDMEELLNYHNEQDAMCTMCVCEYEYQVPYGVIQSQGQRVTKLVEKPIEKYFVNAGIYVVSEALLKQVGHNQVIDMPTLIEQQMEKDELVSLFPLHEYWKDIGQIHDFNQAQEDIYRLGG